MMLPEIVTFNKTLECRLEEYEQIFDGVETSCSEVTEFWRSVFEDLTLIGAGWQALWVLSEENCKKYNLLYPTAVIVSVDEFSWHELTATVQVLAVQEDIVIPSVLEVSVIELHPIKTQDYDEFDLRKIEDWIDKCRYFFRNLWYPWDAKLDVTLMDWCESHLKNRLQMQYDIKNGVFDKAITNYLKSLLAEAHKTGEFLENNYSQEDDRLTVVKSYIRRKIIKTELDLFEEPYLRYGMILLKKNEKHLRSSLENEEVKFVWIKGDCESLIQHLKDIKSVINKKTPIKVLISAQEAVDSSNANDIIILSPGAHALSSLRGIDNNAVIKGLKKNETLITPDTTMIPKAILLECFGLIELENLTISKPNGIAIQVFTGTLKLKNCRIISTEHNSTSRGIVLVSGGNLWIEGCEIQSFGTGVALQSDTHTSIKDTKILDSYEGIKVTENAFLTLENVVISSCHMFGIRLESSNLDSDIPLIGDLKLLTNHKNIIANCVTFNGNGKGDVVVKQFETVLNFDRPLNSDNSNEVICISDKDDSVEDSLEEI